MGRRTRSLLLLLWHVDDAGPLARRTHRAATGTRLLLLDKKKKKIFNEKRRNWRRAKKKIYLRERTTAVRRSLGSQTEESVNRQPDTRVVVIQSVGGGGGGGGGGQFVDAVEEEDGTGRRGGGSCGFGTGGHGPRPGRTRRRLLLLLLLIGPVARPHHRFNAARLAQNDGRDPRIGPSISRLVRRFRVVGSRRRRRRTFDPPVTEDDVRPDGRMAGPRADAIRRPWRAGHIRTAHRCRTVSVFRLDGGRIGSDSSPCTFAGRFLHPQRRFLSVVDDSVASPSNSRHPVVVFMVVVVVIVVFVFIARFPLDANRCRTRSGIFAEPQLQIVGAHRVRRRSTIDD